MMNKKDWIIVFLYAVWMLAITYFTSIESAVRVSGLSLVVVGVWMTVKGIKARFTPVEYTKKWTPERHENWLTGQFYGGIVILLLGALVYFVAPYLMDLNMPIPPNPMDQITKIRLTLFLSILTLVIWYWEKGPYIFLFNPPKPGESIDPVMKLTLLFIGFVTKGLISFGSAAVAVEITNWILMLLQ